MALWDDKRKKSVDRSCDRLGSGSGCGWCMDRE